MDAYAHIAHLQSISTSIIHWIRPFFATDLRFCWGFKAGDQRRHDAHVLLGVFFLNIHVYHLMANITIFSMAVGRSIAVLQLLFAARFQLQCESAK